MDKKEKSFNLEGLEEIAAEKQSPEQQQAAQNILTDEQLEAVKNEVELEQKYGDRPLQTFSERALSSATFGISDQILTKYDPKLKESLRERTERNREAALAGEITGVIAPTALSGGTSLAAKTASAGVKAAAKAGSAIEKITAKQLAKVIQETGKKEIARQVIKKSIPKSLGSAVEGAFYGAGELVKEDALGSNEFNAENLIAYTGAGALLGGAAGSLLGTAEALVPVVKNNRLVDVVSKKVNTNVDRRLAGAKLSKMTPSEIAKLKDNKWGQQVYDNLPKYYQKNLNLKVTDNAEKLFQKSKVELERLGNEIGETALQVDKLAAGTNILPSKSKVASTVQNSLKELEEQFAKIPDETAKKSLKKVQNRIASWDEWLTDQTPITAVELKELKTSLQKAAKWNRSIDQIPIDGKMDRQVAEAVRREFLDLADNVSTVDANIGDKLRQLNLDYGTSLLITDKLKRAVDKEASSELIKFKDLLVADILTDISGGFGVATGAVVTKKFLESDLRRKLTILSDIEKANIKVGSKIKKGISTFFSTAKKSSVPTSTKILLNTSFSLPDESGKKPKKPKDKQEAFKQISESLNELTQNPEKLLTHLSENNALKLTGAAPNTAVAVDSTLITAISFLQGKMPKDASSGTNLFKRKWEPSSLELAKFERYLEAVENPLSVINDLQSGTLTREAVEAVKVVYPDLYTRIQNEAVEYITQNQDVPYEKRLQIGVLLDVPSDASIIPENIIGLQQAFADEQQAQTAATKEQTAIKTTQKGLQNLSFSEDVKSQSEKVATRK